MAGWRTRGLVLLLAAANSGCLIRSAIADDPKAGVRTIPDLAYTSGTEFDDAKNRLDLFVPDAPGPHPMVLFVHGGGWVFGDRHWLADAYGKLGRRLAQRGLVAAVISYRLAPAHRHPAQIQDVSRAVAWMLQHAADHGGDPQRLFLMGHSAGAQLVALAATDPRWLRAQGVELSQLAGVIAVSGPYDVARLGRSTLFGGLPLVVPTFGRDRAVWRDVSPATHLRDATPPPFLVASADGDFPLLRKDAQDFTQALRRAHVPVTQLEIAWRDHFTDITDWGLPGDPLAEAMMTFVSVRPGRSGPAEATAPPSSSAAAGSVGLR